MTLRAPTILIVDDEAQNRRLLAVLLQPEGYRTRAAASGEEALAAIGAAAPDLILLDITMPGMDGYRVASILKADPATANIPIIMVTAHMERSARLASLDAGAEEFLTKPVDRAELWLRVRNLLRLKAYGDLQDHSAKLERQVLARTVDLQRFRTAMDATADAIMLISRDSMRFTEVNETACHLLGYSRADMLSMGPTELVQASRATLESQYDALIVDGARRDQRETRMTCKDGSTVQVEVHSQALRSGSDWTIVVVVRDITERKQAEMRLTHLAHHDALTGLPNRTLFYDTLQRTLALARENGALVAVMFLDLDNFKNINDTLGHAIGDELLLQFSNRLVQCVRVRDTVGRLGGDEFALILIMQDSQQGAVVIAEKIRDALRAPFILRGHEVTITASIGITVHPHDASDPDTLIKYADTAMYQAKHAGRDTYRFFTAQMNANVLARLSIETALRKAIENEEFVLYYQPKVHLNSGRIAGLEALLRWHRPGHGMVAPNEFISVLEETGMIVQVGSWVVAQACRQIGLWLRSPVGPVQVSVNVSGRQFAEGDLDGDIIKGLSQYEIPPDLLDLELTETSLMANTERTTEILHRLKQHGVQISIDDFGTGYSSLAYLRRFPIDKLKIDIAFIRDVTTNPDDAAIVLAIISMAHSLKLDVIAEGVETAAQLNYLRRHHCDQIQGFYFSRPLPADQVTEMLLQDQGLPPPARTGQPSKTLLIIDDDPFMLDILANLFGRDGYHILCARSAAEGFDVLALNEVQVILCDQCMPAMSGTEFLDKVKELYPKTFRIVLSGQTDLESIMKAVNCGAIFRFYTKPWDNNLLRDNVRDAFRQFMEIE
ncbi:EAL domain-containing protein [Massilia antarctica]|uniref:EAL domain-containing protein n=1 Tax=Massilia antarctica TaxID=2765360 RepID=UPI0006BB5666|nr:EAL domain-containing protein [Massilia sp. H27-R4]MCY0912699.1 EAL domain-containing protein [Massilia sp. H27-R4]CUI03765.1 diguanylate cyclase/phosphodiesterase (GGDEF & EAL domains) with PAS/PAC sensor(s) [Janthinobacterium sp. CG23_2]CUU27551.1 diguanylate cyclase/phosphodiesterase (GGDEF & EAL domains) with PAS/PAC sensor(s) [Janthinobacterium sp. CG23_2]